MILLALLIQSATVPVASAPPLQPSGKWTVEYEETMCAASRTYGTGDAAVLFGIKPLALGTQMMVLLAESRSKDVEGRGKGRIDIAPSNIGFDVDYSFYRSAAGQRLTTMFLDRKPLMDALAAASTVTLKFEKRPAVTVAATLTPALAQQLDNCETLLAHSWGVDTTKTALVATPAEPIGSKAEWITVSDYPLDAIRQRQEGESMILWIIKPDGKVSHCRTVKSSGVAALDIAACNAVTKRAHYTPAKDAQGHQVESFEARKVVWRIPSN